MTTAQKIAQRVREKCPYCERNIQTFKDSAGAIRLITHK
jgi:hypothetical protein